MTTSLSAQVPVAADPARTFQIVTDPAYVQAVAVATGGTGVEVTVTATDDGGAVVVSARDLPAEVPAFAKAFVGSSIRIEETRCYGPAAPDGSRQGTVEVGFGSAPLQLTGTLALVPTDTGSAVALDGEMKASVPFVGGKVERFAADQVTAFIAKETEVAAAHLA